MDRAGGTVQVIAIGILKGDIVFDDGVRSPIDDDPGRSEVIVVNGIIEYLAIRRPKVDDDTLRIIPDDIVAGQIAIAVGEKDPGRAAVAKNAVVVDPVVADDVETVVHGAGADAGFVEVYAVPGVVVDIAAVNEIMVGMDVQAVL